MEDNINPLKSKSLVIAIALFFALVLVPTNLKAVCILLSCTVIFINWLQGERKLHTKVSLFLALFFTGTVFTVLYSDNTAYALKKLTTMLSLFVFPLVFCLLSDKDVLVLHKKRHSFFWVFIVSVLLMNLVPFVWYKLTLYGWPNMVEHFPTLLTTNLGRWSIHPIYAAMHICIAILLSFFLWIEKPNRSRLLTLVGINIVLISFLLLYSKKGPILALLVVFTLFIVFQKKKRLFVPSLFIFIALVTLVTINPKTRERFSELLVIENVKNAKETSTNIRYSIYEEALILVQKKGVFGYGIGDYNHVLREQFKKDGNEVLLGKKYNTHNQYLSILLFGGAFLLLLFLIALGMNLIFAIRFDNQVLILLLVFFGIIMFTENILERESGVIYFAFLISFFGLFNREHITTL